MTANGNALAVCAVCGDPVSPGDERVFWADGATGVILFCEACYRQREAGKVMLDGSVQLSLFAGERLGA